MYRWEVIFISQSANVFLKNNIKFLFLIFSAILIIPTIWFYLSNGTILGYDIFLGANLENIVLPIPKNSYISVLILLTLSYLYIIKNYQEYFKTEKQLYLFVLSASIIFIFVLPFVSQDVFYYFGSARLFEHFGIHPYTATIKQLVSSNPEMLQDTILHQGYLNYWNNYVCPYPPLWILITSGVTFLSFGNINICLLIYKLLFAAIHLLCTYLIYEIFKDKKFAVLYGLNPFILLNTVAEGHSDLFVLCFLLLGLHFLMNKKNILVSVIFIAFGVSIKYIAILVLPFFLIYHFRDLTPIKRFVKCVKYGLLFLLIVVLPYIFFITPGNMDRLFLTQQSHFANNFYTLSYITLGEGFTNSLRDILFILFAISYIVYCFYFLFKKEISEKFLLNTCFIILTIFIFAIITNFRSWYLLWVLPFCQNRKSLFLFLTAVPFMLVVILEDNPFVFPLMFYVLIILYFLLNKTKKIKE